MFFCAHLKHEVDVQAAAVLADGTHTPHSLMLFHLFEEEEEEV
jgi:hypothetical protein